MYDITKTGMLLTTAVFAAVAAVFVGGANARILNEEGEVIRAQPAAAVAATLAKGQSNDLLAEYGWGAAATFAKQQTRTALPASADNDLLAQFGWGAPRVREAARLERERRPRPAAASQPAPATFASEGFALSPNKWFEVEPTVAELRIRLGERAKKLAEAAA